MVSEFRKKIMYMFLSSFATDRSKAVVLVLFLLLWGFILFSRFSIKKGTVLYDTKLLVISDFTLSKNWPESDAVSK